MLEHVYILTPDGVARFLPTFTKATHIAKVQREEGNFTVRRDGTFLIDPKNGDMIVPDVGPGWFQGHTPDTDPPYDWSKEVNE